MSWSDFLALLSRQEQEYDVPIYEQLLSLLELLISSPQTEESYALNCFWWPDKRHFWIALNTLKENILLMSRQIHVLKSCHKVIKNLESKRLSFKRKKLLVKQAGGFIIFFLSFEPGHFQSFQLSSDRAHEKNFPGICKPAGAGKGTPTTWWRH